MSLVNSEVAALKSALLWHIDAGADVPLADIPQIALSPAGRGLGEGAVSALPDLDNIENFRGPSSVPAAPVHLLPGGEKALIGASEAKIEAIKLAAAAQTLEELRTAIAGFDGIGLKDTASNLVFAGGQVGSPIMFIGDAPGGDDDREGKPFAGANGQLLDAILKAGGMTRSEGDHTIYISNVLNWRPPGNRSPTPAEIEVSLPFIERHIQLAKPKLLVLLGEVPARALLGKTENISKLRGHWFDYLPQTKELASEFQKRGDSYPGHFDLPPGLSDPESGSETGRLGDILKILEKRNELGLISNINTLTEN